MAKYYNIKDEEVIQTRYKIPEEMLEKKGLLPVSFKTIRLEEGTTKGVRNEAVIEDDVYVTYKTVFYHVDTLEEVKAKKIKDLRNYIIPKFPETFRQINAILGEYDTEKNDSIKKQVSDMRDYIDTHEPLIEALKTIEEVSDYEFRMEEDIPEEPELDENGELIV